MIRFKLYLTLLIDMFRFISRYRQRQAEKERALSRERAEERQHQLSLVQSIVQGVVANTRSSQEGILEIAKAQSIQAEAFSSWLKSFQTYNTSEPVPSSTVRPEDEWLDEQKRKIASGDISAFEDLPPEFQLAFALDKVQHGLGSTTPSDFDREGSDFPQVNG